MRFRINLSLTSLLKMAALVAAPAALAGEKEANIAAFKAAGFTLVNEDCADSQLIADLGCYSSGSPEPIAPGKVNLPRVDYEGILRANPGIQDYLVDGYLPPDHWIALREPTVD